MTKKFETREMPTEYQADVIIDFIEFAGYDTFIYDANGIDVYIVNGNTTIKVEQNVEDYKFKDLPF